MAEIVYVLTNEREPGVCKIGRTSNDLAARIRQLYTTGVILPFELYYACEVEDGVAVERTLHEIFAESRIVPKREFFKVSAHRVKLVLSFLKGREVRLGDEVFETPEDQEAVEQERAKGDARKPPFKFSMLGVTPGSVLKLYKDEGVTCATVDENNRVLFRGSVISLSRAAQLALEDMGVNWPTFSGPYEWTLDGKRLYDLRREIDG